jgi:hypothetical protein
MIVKSGKKYVVKSQSGKRLSKPTSKAAAVKRLRQVEYFKHRSGR